MRTNPEAPLQRVPTAESLDLRRRALSLMRDVTIRPELRSATDPERLERARVCRLQGAASFAVARALEDDVRRRQLGLYARRIA